MGIREAEGMGKIEESVTEDVSGGFNRKVKLGGKPGDTFGNTGRTTVVVPNEETAVRVKGRTDVPSLIRMWRPGFTVCGSFVSKNASAWWSNGGSIVVEVTIDLGPCREAWVAARAAEKIDGDVRLRNEIIPEVKRKTFVSRSPLALRSKTS